MSMVSILPNFELQSSKRLWNPWIDHIMKKHSELKINGLIVMRHDGQYIASSNGLELSNVDTKNIQRCFCRCCADMISVQGVTYCLKSSTDDQVVAFNGRTYIIINKTNYYYIFLKCKSKETSEMAASWLRKVCKRLKNEGR